MFNNYYKIHNMHSSIEIHFVILNYIVIDLSKKVLTFITNIFNLKTEYIK